MTRRPAPGSQSGQAVLIAVMSLLLLGASVGAGLYQVAAKSGLRQQKTAMVTSTNVVKKALAAYVARTFRLPCPANGALGQGNANDGVENCAITGSSGVVPWKTIGISNTDALDGWNHRIGYAVTSSLTSTATAPYRYTPKRTLTLDDAIQSESCAASCGTASKYAFTLISYGANGSGAYTITGSRVPAPTGSSREVVNTTDAPFRGTSAFNVWPGNTSSNAGTAYFDDTFVFETSAMLCNDLNGSSQTSSARPYCNPGNFTPPDATGGTSSGFGGPGQMSNTGQNITGASLANSQSFVGCGGNFCTSATGKLTLNNNLGTVSLTDSNGNAQQITTGNSQLSSNYLDVVGGENTSNCSQCLDPNLNPGYLVPGQILTYEFNAAYASFAMVNFLVDNGMTVKVTALARPNSSAAAISVGELTLANDNSADFNPPCLGPAGITHHSNGQDTGAPPWLKTLLNLPAVPALASIPAPDQNNGYPPPELSQQWTGAIVFGTTVLDNYVNVRDYQFANRVFTDTDGTIFKFNILQFQVEPYVDHSSPIRVTDSFPYHFGMLFEGLKACPSFATENITIGGTMTTNDTIALKFTNASTLGGTVTIGPYTILGTDTATSVADALVSLINANATLRGAQLSATHYNAATNDFGATIQVVSQGDTPLAIQTVIAKTITGAGTETVSLSSTTGYMRASLLPGPRPCDMRGAGVSPLYSDSTNLAEDEWWNPPMNQTMDCSLQDGLTLQ